MIPSHLNLLMAPERRIPRYTVADPRVAKIVPYTPRGGRPTSAQAAGLRYEAAFLAFARRHWGHSFITFTEQQIIYSDRIEGWKTCRPDGVLFIEDTFTVFEVKTRHTEAAWWQLWRLYIPVLQLLYPHRRPVAVEVTRSFDPTEPFPPPVHHISTSELLLGDPFKPDGVNILQWNS